MTTLQDKTAFITGGASGIGLAIARALLDVGAHVALADVEATALERAKKSLTGLGGRVTTHVLDVTDRTGFASARDAAIKAHGAVHLLFNNAGVNAAGPIEARSYRDWDWVIGVNLGGVINGVQTFLPELMRHGSEAHLINTASVGGLVGMRNLAIYNASKFAVVGLTEAIRADMKTNGMGVSVLCPGVIATALTTSERNRPEHLRNADAQPVLPASGAGNPDGAMSPDDFAAFVLAGIRENRFWVVSHPEFRGLVDQRNQAVISGYRGEAEPARIEAMKALVEPFS